jgi:hypothetical protein
LSLPGADIREPAWGPFMDWYLKIA